MTASMSPLIASCLATICAPGLTPTRASRRRPASAIANSPSGKSSPPWYGLIAKAPAGPGVGLAQRLACDGARGANRGSRPPVLHRGLERAVSLEIISRNAAHPVRPPKVERDEIAILTADQVADTLRRIEDHPLYPVAALAVATGMRRGEICALVWGRVDLDAATVRVECSL